MDAKSGVIWKPEIEIKLPEDAKKKVTFLFTVETIKKSTKISQTCEVLAGYDCFGQVDLDRGSVS